MQKEEKDSLTTDNKKLRTQRVLDRFDGAGLLTLRKLTSEELELLVDYVNQHRLGARGAVPAARPQQQSEIKKKEQ
ncbi:uncharacterized protein METZ01_LOCUS304221 [marine metagenome]|uniref:Uncharacterized protein n=1 Tax=marine metagenome TaxID=408172 RepID=A0A382MUD0_9ZZZZ